MNLNLDGQLAIIRLQQAYGFFSLVYLYIALLATPLSAVFPRFPGIGTYLQARRAFGVSAFFFAFLHTSVVFFGQLGGFNGLSYLSPVYLISITLGTVGLLILLLMSLTSFDYAIEKMGFKNWKRLHRFIYLGGIAVLVHVFLIGSHTNGLESAGSQVIFLSLVILALLEAVRIDRKRNKKLFLGSFGYFTAVVAIATIALLFFFITSAKAFAHTLESEGSIGAVLHIDPQDEPIAGEPSNLYFDLTDQKGKFKFSNCICTLLVKDGSRIILTVSMDSPNKEVIFPTVGAYTLELNGKPKASSDFNDFNLTYIVRAEDGASAANLKGLDKLSFSVLTVTVVGVTLLISTLQPVKKS